MFNKFTKMLSDRKNEILIFSALILFYLATHLAGLTKLPVFSDEAIYIRWTQLIMDDWKRYLFFPMNDGKTPFFIWAMLPFQYIFSDQLFAGRVVSVFVGLIQLFVAISITANLGASKKFQYLSAFLVAILPFWYFHHRMALMDGLLTLMISISYLFLIKLFVRKKRKQKNDSVLGLLFSKANTKYIILTGFFFGLGLFTKTPAILFLPAFYLTILYSKKLDMNKAIVGISSVTIVVFIGIAMFLSLALSESFTQLFNVGSSFLYPLGEFITHNRWTETIPSIPTYIWYFVNYLTPSVILFILFGLFSKKNKRQTHILFWSGVLFFLPIALLGKVVYPRYLFPASLFFTLAAVMGLEGFYVGLMKRSNQLWAKFLSISLIAVLIANTITGSLNFMQQLVINPDSTLFVSADISQYLTKWSSGHGIKETVELIQNEAKESRVAVGTEGSFGTLPDGINLYLHGENVDNIYIEGIGYPVGDIPQKFADRASEFDKVWIVVNSNRMGINLDSELLITEYCRPYNSSCLQVWDMSDIYTDFLKPSDEIN